MDNYYLILSLITLWYKIVTDWNWNDFKSQIPDVLLTSFIMWQIIQPFGNIIPSFINVNKNVWICMHKCEKLKILNQ